MICEDKLGEGSYGIVYRCKRGQDYVILKRNLIDQTVSGFGSLRELDTLHKFRNHPHVVQLLSITVGNSTESLLSPLKNKQYKDDNLHFVMEKALYDGHALLYELNKVPDYVEFKTLLVDFLLGLEYIHGRGYIHRDLKPSNLLIFPPNSGMNRRHLKICDFGLSKPNNYDAKTPRIVTPWYQAPESLTNNYSFAIDMWSVGCIIYEFFTGTPLFHDCPKDQPTEYIEGRLKKLAGDIPSFKEFLLVTKMKDKYLNITNSWNSLQDLLQRLLCPEEKRLNAAACLNHSFFRSHSRYINSVREAYPPKRLAVEVTIFPSKEREWTRYICFNLFNVRDSLDWYTHQVVFLAISIFDRYLLYRRDLSLNPGAKSPPESVKSKEQGDFHSRFGTYLRFVVCLYMAVKYLATNGLICSYSKFVIDTFNTEEAVRFAEEFEIYLLQEVLQFEVYQETVLDAAFRLSYIPKDNQIKTIKKFLQNYGNLTQFKGTLEELTLKCWN